MTTRGALIRGYLIIAIAGLNAVSGAFQSWSDTWNLKDWILAIVSVGLALHVAGRAYYDQSMGDAKKNGPGAPPSKTEIVNAPDNPVPVEERKL